jgi:hypothetical protein
MLLNVNDSMSNAMLRDTFYSSTVSFHSLSVCAMKVFKNSVRPLANSLPFCVFIIPSRCTSFSWKWSIAEDLPDGGTPDVEEDGGR